MVVVVVVVILVEGGGGREISRLSGAILPFAGYTRFGCITFEELVKFTIKI